MCGVCVGWGGGVEGWEETREEGEGARTALASTHDTPTPGRPCTASGATCHGQPHRASATDGSTDRGVGDLPSITSIHLAMATVVAPRQPLCLCLYLLSRPPPPPHTHTAPPFAVMSLSLFHTLHLPMLRRCAATAGPPGRSCAPLARTKRPCAFRRALACVRLRACARACAYVCLRARM
jgi:hypothetical protein